MNKDALTEKKDAGTGKKTAQDGDKKGHEGYWCEEHGVPEEMCSICMSAAEAKNRFKDKGDWCQLHDRAIAMLQVRSQTLRQIRSHVRGQIRQETRVPARIGIRELAAPTRIDVGSHSRKER